MNELWDFIESIQTDSIGFSEGEKEFIKDVFENENFVDIYEAIDKIDNQSTKENCINMIILNLCTLLNAKSLNQSKKDDKKRILKEAIRIMNETNTVYKPLHIKERRINTIKDLEYELFALEMDYKSSKDKVRQTLKNINKNHHLGLSNKQIKFFIDSIKISEENIQKHNPRY